MRFLSPLCIEQRCEDVKRAEILFSFDLLDAYYPRRFVLIDTRDTNLCH